MNLKNVKIFADGADPEQMVKLSKDPMIKGLTTNPTLMKAAGIIDYTRFAHTVLASVTQVPISFEVFADDFDEMYRQAKLINSWGPNVYVKIPVTNSEGKPAKTLIQDLANEGVKLNVTAILTLGQVDAVCAALNPDTPAVVSVFAGRIADTGVDPVPLMKSALVRVRTVGPKAELLWASPREILNVVQADEIGCDIITVTPSLLSKLNLIGKNLEEFSLETVQMFKNDAEQVGYRL